MEGVSWRVSESKLFSHGHTYGGNPLAAAVANATLDVFEQERTLDQLPEKIDRLGEHLARIAELPHVGDCRQRGMMAGIELVQDRTTKQPYPWQEKHGIRACQHARKLGVWLRPLLDVIVILPPLSVTLDELDRICQAAASRHSGGDLGYGEFEFATASQIGDPYISYQRVCCYFSVIPATNGSGFSEPSGSSQLVAAQPPYNRHSRRAGPVSSPQAHRGIAGWRREE